MFLYLACSFLSCACMRLSSFAFDFAIVLLPGSISSVLSYTAFASSQCASSVRHRALK